MEQYVTWSDFIQFGIMLIAFATLIFYIADR